MRVKWEDYSYAITRLADIFGDQQTTIKELEAEVERLKKVVHAADIFAMKYTDSMNGYVDDIRSEYSDVREALLENKDE